MAVYEGTGPRPCHWSTGRDKAPYGPQSGEMMGCHGPACDAVVTWRRVTYYDIESDRLIVRYEKSDEFLSPRARASGEKCQPLLLSGECAGFPAVWDPTAGKFIHQPVHYARRRLGLPDNTDSAPAGDELLDDDPPAHAQARRPARRSRAPPTRARLALVARARPKQTERNHP